MSDKNLRISARDISGGMAFGQGAKAFGAGSVFGNQGPANNRNEFAEQLGYLQAELARIKEAGGISEAAAVDAEYQLKRATIETKNPSVHRGNLLDYLSNAKKFIETAATAEGLVTAVGHAIEAAKRLF